MKNHTQQFLVDTPRISVGLLLFSLFLPTMGCNTLGFGASQQLKELQAENERLLTEFRAQRNERERAEEALRLMESRLAESEKLIARQYTPNTNRISQLYPARSNNLPSSIPSPGPFPGQVRGWNQGAGGFAEQVDPNSGLRWQRRMTR